MSTPRDMKKGFALVLATLLAVIIGTLLMLVSAMPAGATSGGHKVTICHKDSQTITIDKNAWKAHEKHGDYKGECTVTPDPTPDPVIVDNGECLGTTQWEAWQTIDGVPMESTVTDLTQAEAETAGCYTAPEAVTCEEWSAPGIVDEYGNPTACVDDHPCPGLNAPDCELPPVVEEVVPVVEIPVASERTLAHTGPSDWLPLLGVAATCHHLQSGK